MTDPLATLSPIVQSATTREPTAPKDAKEAAKQFESLLVSMLLKEMHKTTTGALFGGSTAMFQDFFDQEIADRIADSGGLGLADKIEGDLSGRSRSAIVRRFLNVDPPVLSRTNPFGEPPGLDSSPEGWLTPVMGRISSVFGRREDPFHGDERSHKGLDIAANRGTPIQAVRSGTVAFSGSYGSYGNLVIMKHEDGLETRYAHCDKLKVKAGDRVDAGDIVATVGSTGRSTGPHLHFEVRSNGTPVDPESFLRSPPQKKAQLGVEVIREGTQAGVGLSYTGRRGAP